MEGRNLDLTQGVIWKQLILFFLPILAGSIFQQLYTTVDAVIIGQFAGKSGLAAIDSVHNLLKLPLNFFTGLSAGATILVSQLFGGKQLRRLAQVARTAIAFSFAGGVLLSILGIVFAPACLDLLEVPQDIYSQTLSYVRIYFFGLSVSLLYNLGAGILRAVGNSRTPFSILLLSCSLNLVLDLFFVGFLRLGASGAAATTVLSQTVSALLILYVLIKSSDLLKIRDHAQTPDPRTAPAFDPSPSQKRGSLLRLFPFRIHRESLLSILRLGIPLGLQSSFYPIANMMIQTSINGTGTDSFAAWALCGKLDFLIWLSTDALAAAISTFAAQNYGAKHYRRIQKGVASGLFITSGIVALLSILLYLFSGTIGKLFLHPADHDILPLVVSMMHFLAPFYLLYVFGEILSGAIRGTGETFLPMLVSLLGTCAARILWILFVVPGHPSILVILGSYPVSWFLTALLFSIYYLYIRRTRLSPSRR